MVRLILVILFVLAVLGATAVLLLGPRSFAETRNVIVPRTTPSLKTSKTLKRTWQTGPASIPPEEEIVSRRGAFPAPVKLFAGESQPERLARPAGKSRESLPVSGPAVPKTVARDALTTSSVARGPAAPRVVTVDDVVRPVRVDPEARARADLTCLHEDSQARQAFYADLRRTAEQVRTGVSPTNPATKSTCSAVTEDSPRLGGGAER